MPNFAFPDVALTQVCDYSNNVGDNMPKLVGPFYPNFPNRPIFVNYYRALLFASRDIRPLFSRPKAQLLLRQQSEKDNC